MKWKERAVKVPFNVLAKKPILIALSDGHGSETAGKRTPVFPEGGYMKENEFNSRVVTILDEELRRCGFHTLLVAPTSADTPLRTRVSLANARKADLYLSIHANALLGRWGTANGIETFTIGSGEGLRVGRIVHKWVMQGTKLTNRNLKNGSHLYEIKQTNMPAVLVECGFMDNLKEARLLKSEAYRQETAIELAKALCEAYNYTYKSKTTSAAKPTSPTTKPTSTKRYIVQVAAFSNEANAYKLSKEMCAKGINTEVTPMGGLYKVICGGFADEKLAEARVAALLRRGYKAIII